MKHVIHLVLYFFFCTLTVYAQDPKIKTLDSIEQVYTSGLGVAPAKTSISRIKSFIRTLEDFKIKDSVYLHKKGKAHNLLILLYASQRQVDSARYHYNQIISNYEDKSLRVFAHQKMALAEYFDLNHSKALYYYDEALKDAEFIEDKSKKLEILFDLCTFYRYAKDYESAQEVLELIQQNIKNTSSRTFLFKLKYEEFHQKIHRKDYQKALQVLFEIDTSNLHKNKILFRAYHEAFVDAYVHLKRYDSALYYNDIAVNDKRSVASFSPIDDYTYYANIYHKKGNHQMALNYLNRISDTTKANNSNYSLRDFHELSYKVHKALGNTKLAFNNYEAYNKINTSIDEEIKQQQQNILKYKINKDKALNELKYKQMIEQDEQKKKLYFVVVISLSIIAITIILFLIYKNKKNKRQLFLEQESRINAFKNEHIENISHEFRTPLTLIYGISQLLRESKDQNLNHHLSEIDKQSKELLDMVDDLLDISKAESDEVALNLVQSDIILHADYVVDALKYLAIQKDISLSLETTLKSQFMDFDVEKLKIILINLISNAIKYTPTGGEVKVIISKDTHQNLLIAIKDNGAGMNEAELERIFERFYQSKNKTDIHQKGYGIGLHFTKQLINAMKGKIHIESKENKGTLITVELPISQEQPVKTIDSGSEKVLDNLPVPEKTTIEKKPGKGSATILIVEDNKSVRSLLSEQLNDYRIIEAEDGEEGIQKAKKELPDIIISDIMMPNINGYEMTENLKSNKETSHIPIILLTAKADHHSKIKGLKVKADTYITKPYDVNEIKLSINNLIENRRALHEIYKNFSTDSPVTKLPDEDLFIKELRQFIINNIEKESFDINEICKNLKISRSGLHNKIKSLTGLSITNYINHLKLQRSLELLKKTNLNISEISAKTGFKSYEYFARKFKKEFGVSPKQFRDAS
jgi:signal transduction histidine kinase/DNA-binding response OmpR family regulator